VVDVAVVVGTEMDEEVVGVNAIPMATMGIFARRGTTKTHEMARVAGVETLEEEGTINLRTITLPLLKSRVIRTGDTRPKTLIRTTNRAVTEDHPSHRTNPGLRINNLPTEVVEGEGTIPDMMARTAAGRMGTMEDQEVLLPIEGVRLTAAVGIAIREATKEVREGGMGMVAIAVDTTNPHRALVTAEVGIVEALVITLVETINPVGHINLEVINLVGGTHRVEPISLVDRTTPVSSLTGTKEGTINEVEVAEKDIDHGRTSTHDSCLLRPRSPLALGTLFPLVAALSVILSTYILRFETPPVIKQTLL